MSRALAILVLCAGCNDGILIVTVDGLPGEASKLVVRSALDDRLAADEPFDAPAGGFGGSTSFALRLAYGTVGRLSIVVEALRDDGCVVAEESADNQVSNDRKAIEVAVAPLAAPDCSGKMPTPGMVSIPAGTFLMGCNSAVDSACLEDESPTRMVTLSAFEIDRTEITVGAYRGCVDAHACDSPIASQGSGDLPQAYLSWAQADAYCRFRGKRLPTEAEWEKAARGTDGRRYPWGNDLPGCTRLNYSANTMQSSFACGNIANPIRPVGQFPDGASPYGVLDLSGNIEEWVNDWYGPYPDGPATDPPGATGPTSHLVRGGSWADDAVRTRTSYRDSTINDDGSRPPPYTVSAEFARGLIGGRCARTP
jgi:formylglycine-generating enzyme required for sulfatase activity